MVIVLADVLCRPLHPLSTSEHRMDERTLDRFWLPGKPAVGSISHLARGKNRPAGISYLHNLDVRRTEWSRRAEHLMSESSPAETERPHVKCASRKIGVAGKRRQIGYGNHVCAG